MGTFSSVFDNEPIDTSFLEEADIASDRLFGTFDHVFGQFDHLHDTIVTSAAINYKKLMLESMHNGMSRDEFSFMEESNEESLGQKLKTMLLKLQQMWKEFITKMRRVITEKICNHEFHVALEKVKKKSTTDSEYRDHKIHYSARVDCLKDISKAIDGIDKTIAKILSKWRRSDDMKGKTLQHRMKKYDKSIKHINTMFDQYDRPGTLLTKVTKLQKEITKVLDKEDSEVSGLLTRALTLADKTKSATLRDELIGAVRERTELSRILCQHAVGLLKDHTGAIIRDANKWNLGGKKNYRVEQNRKRAEVYDGLDQASTRMAMMNQWDYAQDRHQLMQDQHRFNQMMMDGYGYGFEEAIDLSELMEEEESPQVQLEDAGLVEPISTTSSDEEYLEEMNALFNDEFDY